MAPRPTQPRLAELKATEIAIDIGMELQAHLERVAALLGRTTASKNLMSWPVEERVRTILAFAQTGEDAEAARAALTELMGAYYGSAALGPSEPAGFQATAIGVLCLATRARLDVLKGELVHHQGLAALAGMHPSRVLALSAGNDSVLRRLGRRSGLIDATSARAWLIEQGVPGFEKQR